MIYVLNNPHDTYSFEASDPVVAATVALLLGGASYGAQSVGSDAGDHLDWPVCLGRGDVPDLFLSRFDVTLEEALKGKRGAIAGALESLLICKPEDRDTVKSMLAACSTDAERAKVHSDCRSSLTNLLPKARHVAEIFRVALEAQASE